MIIIVCLAAIASTFICLLSLSHKRTVLTVNMNACVCMSILSQSFCSIRLRIFKCAWTETLTSVNMYRKHFRHLTKKKRNLELAQTLAGHLNNNYFTARSHEMTYLYVSFDCNCSRGRALFHGSCVFTEELIELFISLWAWRSCLPNGITLNSANSRLVAATMLLNIWLFLIEIIVCLAVWTNQMT